jgi:thymidylate kinase
MGRTVVCDRYLDDTRVDFRLNFPGERFERWWSWRLLARVAPRAEATFLLCIPVDESERRSLAKREPFPETRDVRQQRQCQYDHLARVNRWHVLDGCQPPGQLAALIRARLGPASPGPPRGHLRHVPTGSAAGLPPAQV